MTSIVQRLIMENTSTQTFFFPDVGAKMEPHKGKKKRTRKPKHRSSESSDSQGAAGHSTSRPNSDAGTWKTYHNVINKIMSVSKSKWHTMPVIDSYFHGIKRLEI